MICTYKKDDGRELWCVSPVQQYPDFLVVFLTEREAKECVDGFATGKLSSPLLTPRHFIEITQIGSSRVFCLNSAPNDWFVVKTVHLSNGLSKHKIVSSRTTAESASNQATVTAPTGEIFEDLAVMSEVDLIKAIMSC